MNAFYIAIWFFVCVIGQVLIFNHLPVWGGVVLLYVYLIIKMPVEVGRALQILIAFLMGFVIDVLSNTPGMNALACTTVMWARLPILHLYVLADDFKSGIPNRRVIGQSLYTKFCITIIVVHTVLLYFIEAFTCFNFLHILAKIILSIVLTSAAFLLVEEFQYRDRRDMK